MFKIGISHESNSEDRYQEHLKAVDESVLFLGSLVSAQISRDTKVESKTESTAKQELVAQPRYFNTGFEPFAQVSPNPNQTSTNSVGDVQLAVETSQDVSVPEPNSTGGLDISGIRADIEKLLGL